MIMLRLAVCLALLWPCSDGMMAREHRRPDVREVHGRDASLWRRQRRADLTHPLAVQLTLATNKTLAQLDAVVQAVSNAASPSYGSYVSQQQLQAHWQPSLAAQNAIHDFLAHPESSGIQATRSPHGDFVTLRMDVATAERVFDTTLFEYEHRDAHHVRVIRPRTQFIVPDLLSRHVVFIDGLEAFPTPRQALTRARQLRPAQDTLHGQDGDPLAIKTWPPMASPPVVTTTTDAANANVMATPTVVRDFYGLPNDFAHLNGTHERNKLVIGAFLDEYYREQDIVQALTRLAPVHGARLPQFPKRIGSCLASESSKGRATGEASLDVQVAVSLTHSESIEMLCLQQLRNPLRPLADDNQEPFLLFMQAVNAMEPPPAVVSISYTDEECALPKGYALAVNREFLKAAMRGISILVSAGDAGVQGSHMSSFCGIQPCSRFVPMFPTSSPYVTSVGATSLHPRTNGLNPQDDDEANSIYEERVTSSANGALITSGGGFSELFDRPAYQEEAVGGYLSGLEPRDRELLHGSGRGYPDITAIGHSFPVFVNGELTPTDGTSVSAPIVASMIVLLNKLRLSQGLPVLGFLNPLLYQLQHTCPHLFRDITQGDTACGSADVRCCALGLEARAGWDAASGVGSIRFDIMALELQQCVEQIQREAAEAKDHVRVDASQQESFQSRDHTVHGINLLQESKTGGVAIDVEARHILVSLAAIMVLVSVMLAVIGRSVDGPREPAQAYLLAHEDTFS